MVRGGLASSLASTWRQRVDDAKEGYRDAGVCSQITSSLQRLGTEPLLDELLALSRWAVQFESENGNPAYLDTAGRLRVYEKAILKQIHQEDVEHTRQLDLVRVRMFGKESRDSLFEIAVATIQDGEVFLVLLHSSAVDLALVEPAVARRTQSDEVIEGVLFDLVPRDNVGDFHRPLVTRRDGAAMPRFHQDIAL